MSNKAETQYNPQCGVRRTIFQMSMIFSQKLNQCVPKKMEYIFGTYMERPYSHSSYYILTPSVFRFVMVPEMTAKSHRQTVVEDVPESEFETKMQNLQKMKICIYMKQIS